MKLKLLFPFILLLSAFSAFSQTENVKYIQMTENERNKFIEDESNRFLTLFRTVGDYKIDAENLKEVKRYVDGYLQRKAVSKSRSAECKRSDDLTTILQRGKLNAPVINSVFTEKELPVQLGLYVAMTESAFCPCIQSPTGPLGIFQLTYSSGELYGINAVKGATPQKPDDRCKVKPAATGAANYLKKLLDTDFGNNSIGAPFALSAYYSGEGITKKLIRTANQDNKENFTYWSLKKFDFKSVSDNELSESTTEMFENEISSYFPKFLAAMIIGENPRSFGIQMNRLSEIK